MQISQAIGRATSGWGISVADPARFELQIETARRVAMSVQVTRKHAGTFRDLIQPMLDSSYRCKRRLEAKGFDHNTRLFRLVDKAYNAMHSLQLSCARTLANAEWAGAIRIDAADRLTFPKDRARPRPNHRVG